MQPAKSTTFLCGVDGRDEKYFSFKTNMKLNWNSEQLASFVQNCQLDADFMKKYFNTDWWSTVAADGLQKVSSMNKLLGERAKKWFVTLGKVDLYE